MKVLIKYFFFFSILLLNVANICASQSPSVSADFEGVKAFSESNTISFSKDASFYQLSFSDNETTRLLLAILEGDNEEEEDEDHHLEKLLISLYYFYYNAIRLDKNDLQSNGIFNPSFRVPFAHTSLGKCTLLQVFRI